MIHLESPRNEIRYLIPSYRHWSDQRTRKTMNVEIPVITRNLRWNIGQGLRERVILKEKIILITFRTAGRFEAMKQEKAINKIN